MKLSRSLLKKIAFVCLSLVTALLLIAMESASIAQVNRTPAPEIFPNPNPTPEEVRGTIRQGTTGTPVQLSGTWLLPVPTANAQLANPIVANPDVATVPYRESRSIPVLSNDLGEGLSIIEVSQSEEGTIQINPDGTITYGSVNDGSSDRFSYTIRDQYGRTATGTVFIDVIFPQ